jgi:hypothetical protein
VIAGKSPRRAEDGGGAPATRDGRRGERQVTFS